MNLKRKDMIYRFERVLFGVFNEMPPKTREDLKYLAIRLYNVLYDEENLKLYSNMGKGKRIKKKVTLEKKIIDKKMIVELFKKGLTQRKIAEKCNCSNHTVCVTIKKHLKKGN